MWASQWSKRTWLPNPQQQPSSTVFLFNRLQKIAEPRNKARQLLSLLASIEIILLVWMIWCSMGHSNLSRWSSPIFLDVFGGLLGVLTFFEMFWRHSPHLWCSMWLTDRPKRHCSETFVPDDVIQRARKRVEDENLGFFRRVGNSRNMSYQDMSMTFFFVFVFHRSDVSF